MTIYSKRCIWSVKYNKYNIHCSPKLLPPSKITVYAINVKIIFFHTNTIVQGKCFVK